MSDDATTTGTRGQLVLVAAAVIAIALLVILAAYVQLGYTGDVRAVAATDAPTADAGVALEQAASIAGSRATGDSPRATARAFDRTFREAVATIESVDVDRTAVYRVDRNTTAAMQYVQRCEAAAFGSCTVIDGIIIQQRAGTPTVWGVTVDLRVVSPDMETEQTRLLHVRPDREDIFVSSAQS